MGNWPLYHAKIGPFQCDFDERGVSIKHTETGQHYRINNPKYCSDHMFMAHGSHLFYQMKMTKGNDEPPELGPYRTAIII